MKKSMAVVMAIIVGVVSATMTFFVMNKIHDDEMNGDENSLALSEFSEVEQLIDKYYLKDYDISEVQYAGLKAMVASLGDEYSTYYTPEEFASFNRQTSGEYYGLGMIISVDEVMNLVRVEYFFDDSSAEESGIEVGDFIISVDGEDVTKKTLQEISLLCTGEEGTTVILGMMRGSDVLEYTLERRPVEMDMLGYGMIDDDIGYMRIAQFGGNCTTLFAEAMGSFTDQNAKGVVIDLRNNPGGYLGTVIDVLDMLLPEGTIVYTEDKNGHRKTSSSDAAFIDIPVTLIVNENTASAAEIFAGAVQDYGCGEVVGTTTYGKGVVQVVIPIESGGAVKITASEYFTPNGRSIHGNGIYPDHYIELPEDFATNEEAEDTQKNKAIEVLQQLID